MTDAPFLLVDVAVASLSVCLCGIASCFAYVKYQSHFSVSLVHWRRIIIVGGVAVVVGCVSFFSFVSNFCTHGGTYGGSHLALAGKFGFSLVCAASIFLAAFDACASLLPDRLQLFGALGVLVAMAASIAEAQVLDLAPLLIGAGLPAVIGLFNIAYQRVRPGRQLGLGDLKLLAWWGPYLGTAAWSAFFVASVLGVAATLGWNRVAGTPANSPRPFGPILIPVFLAAKIWELAMLP